ncbi:MAG: methionine ABC transporter ATP-binding protein [Candidatus Devosia phytovorans]|uniref:Cell division ATP-binding protein FtsE n=1 Tax=Candidatus Devosia phytovorans TaxID=3121372 RepID=A0AAJ5VQM7_9HYPH|nr:methionine ABC transporter ATP-binding protein [Devosia sp.]WEK02966.1 MAG: methionine ABC transporter ATP-binding protein [Devosia sp.]
MSLTHPVEAAIEIRSVEKTYPAKGANAATTALHRIDLDVPKGSILGVIGRSGAGKSTLIRLVNGLERPTAGSVAVNGAVISALDEVSLRQERRSIGMIFQHFNLLARRTALANVALPLEIAGVPSAEIRRRVLPLLDLVGLADKAGRYPAELSGGQKQRVGIARALATNPKVLLSDEATSALDPETTEQILTLLRQVNRELNLTVLLITHEMAVIKSVADRVAVIDGGSIVEEGETFDLFTHPQHATTRNFVSALTGTQLPAHLAVNLASSPAPGKRALLQLTFRGAGADHPFLSTLTRRLDVDLGIVQAKVDHIAGRPFGTLIVAVDADAAKLAALKATATELGLETEVLGYA